MCSTVMRGRSIVSQGHCIFRHSSAGAERCGTMRWQGSAKYGLAQVPQRLAEHRHCKVTHGRVL